MKRFLGLLNAILILGLLVTGCPTPTPMPTVTPLTPTLTMTAALRIGLVTPVGSLTRGTVDSLAWDGLVWAQEDFGAEIEHLEAALQEDFGTKIQDLLDRGFNVIVTSGYHGYLAAIAAADSYPDVTFIVIGHVPPDELEARGNMVNLQYRKDQIGFLAGILAGLLTENGIVGGVYLEGDPWFRNGFENGVHYTDSSYTVIGQDVFQTSLSDPAMSTEIAEYMLNEGADVVFAYGGTTASMTLRRATENNRWAVGAMADHYYESFGEDNVPGTDYFVSSIMPAVDWGIYLLIERILEGTSPGGEAYVLDVVEDGIFYTTLPEAIFWAELVMEDVYIDLAEGVIETGIEPGTGEKLFVPTPPPLSPLAELPQPPSDRIAPPAPPPSPPDLPGTVKCDCEKMLFRAWVLEQKRDQARKARDEYNELQSKHLDSWKQSMYLKAISIGALRAASFGHMLKNVNMATWLGEEIAIKFLDDAISECINDQTLYAEKLAEAAQKDFEKAHKEYYEVLDAMLKLGCPELPWRQGNTWGRVSEMDKVRKGKWDLDCLK